MPLPSTNLLLNIDPAFAYSTAGHSTLCTNGQGVYTLADQSGNGFDFVQATGGNQPTFESSVLNSLPTVRSAGAKYMTQTALNAPSGGYTAFAVVNMTAVNSTAEWLFDCKGSQRLVLLGTDGHGTP